MSFPNSGYAVIATKEYMQTLRETRTRNSDAVLDVLANKTCKILHNGYNAYHIPTVNVELLNVPGDFWLNVEALADVLDVFNNGDMVRLIPDEDMMRSVVNRQCDGIFIPNQMIEQLGGQIVQITDPSETAFMVEINDHTWVVPWRYIDRKAHNSELSAFSDDELDKILII